MLLTSPLKAADRARDYEIHRANIKGEVPARLQSAFVIGHAVHCDGFG